MKRKQTGSDKSSKSEALSYFIDSDWFQKNARSFAVVTFNYLCPDCQERSVFDLRGMEVASLNTCEIDNSVKSLFGYTCGAISQDS